MKAGATETGRCFEVALRPDSESVETGEGEGDGGGAAKREHKHLAQALIALKRSGYLGDVGACALAQGRQRVDGGYALG
jgi:hypothetical protein